MIQARSTQGNMERGWIRDALHGDFSTGVHPDDFTSREFGELFNAIACIDISGELTGIPFQDCHNAATAAGIDPAIWNLVNEWGLL